METSYIGKNKNKEPSDKR